LPLYNGSASFENYDKEFNTGLWYDKYCNTWKVSGGYWNLGADDTASGKIDWIKQLSEKEVGSKPLVEEHVNRLGSMIVSQKGMIRVFECDWHFVTGLGKSHPVENGFAWHHILGIPYLPGSTVKGIVRAWAKEWVEADDSTINRIFGPHDSKEKNVGSVIFYDALAALPVKLTTDVMTPHYGEYYGAKNAGSASSPPGDWYSPVPVYFLTVASKQPFVFAIAPRRPAIDESVKDCVLAIKWLEEALSFTGAGAKTASGYGRFTRATRRESDISKQFFKPDWNKNVSKAISIKDDDHLAIQENSVKYEMERDGYSKEPDKFMGIMTSKWLIEMKDEKVDIKRRKEIASLLMDWYINKKADQWKKPNDKNAKKIEEIKKVLELQK
jgi:CRISPR-associated protein Cmr6